MPRSSPIASATLANPVSAGERPGGLLSADLALTSVQRAIADFKAGRPILIDDGDSHCCLVLPVDGLTPERLADLRAISDRRIELCVSARRVAALADGTAGAAVMPLGDGLDCAAILDLASGHELLLSGPVVAGNAIAAAAIELGKLAALLPAALAVPLPMLAGADALRLLQRVEANAILDFRGRIVESLVLAAEARVPLQIEADTRFVIFRDALGRNWTAVVVGRPDTARPVPLRLHSSCLTGDTFGSLRCDCGDQLRMALEIIRAHGGGVVLYLDQEGCGIGLANKMRAYSLQDAGLDTIDANIMLGFERDERRYDIAAKMLELLKIDRIALLTNNPDKIAGLREVGIDIVDRIPLQAPVHGSNRRYLEAKARRAGHLIGDFSGDN